MRNASVVMALTALCVSTTAFAGLNPLITLPLHGKASGFEACTGYLPVDCLDNRPTVDVQAVPTAVFLLANNHTSLAGVQTAFEWPGWSLAFGLWDCQGGQLSAVTPMNPGGPTAGSITTAFNCITTQQLAVIGRMHFQPAGAPGCISQVESSFPFGNHVVDCELGTDIILHMNQGLQQRLGKICVGTGGHDACDAVVAVEPTTWGQIKTQYN
jgi:hypothetical protein